MVVLAVNGVLVDIPGGWATIIVAGVTFVIGPVVTIILQARMSGRIRGTHEQVVNSHAGQPPLRDDIDAIKRGVEHLQEGQERHDRDIRGIRDEIGQLRQTERAQWAAIEQTQSTSPRPRRSQPKKERS